MKLAFATVGLLAFVLAIGPARAATPSYASIERGRYLVAAGDCAACHTAEDGQPFAGGRAVPTPFGTIYATNLTPDPETGLGHWSEDDFYRALHEGIRRDGQHLYPAFPYPWYTRLTRDDVTAIYHYLRTVPAVHEENKPPELPWPLDWRPMMAVWNALFFKPGTYRADTGKPADWNRGAYLVEGFGHCSACHSPKNALGAVERSARFAGGFGEGWYAPPIDTAMRAGLGNWSDNDIVQYLKTGANAHAAASGPMAEVVQHSTQHLDEGDLRAMAVYLKSLPAPERNAGKAADDRDALARGRDVYLDQCAGCHMEDGSGQRGIFPPLQGNAGLQAADASDAVRAVLEGTREVATHDKPTAFAMPAFGWKLSDQDVADVVTYVRNAFGNRGSAVATSAVRDMRDRIRQASAQ